MQRKTYDAILIPGGGIKNRGDLPLWVKRRLDRAVELHQEEYIITLSAGTVHKPPPSGSDGFPLFESIAGARYLVKKGIEPQKILCETCSYDTVGNAYFSRVIHVEPGNFRKLLVITSQFHMPRTKAIFQWVYGLTSSAATGDYDLDFEEVSDAGMDETALQARIEREKASLQNVMRLKKEIQSFEEFHRWLFSEHDAYSLSKAPQRAKGDILHTY